MSVDKRHISGDSLCDFPLGPITSVLMWSCNVSGTELEREPENLWRNVSANQYLNKVVKLLASKFTKK